jgi:hypothetical protein
MPGSSDLSSPNHLPFREEPDAAPRPTSPGVAEGEDDALILWMLSLTPIERLAVAQGFADSVMALRDGRLT